VTRCAVIRKLQRSVVGAGCLVVIGAVTTVAGVRSCRVITVVAGGTIVCDRRVRSVQRIKIVVNWEGRGRPAGSCGVAHRAICR
jgi:hypothetical protein